MSNYWQVEKFHNNGTSTASLYETRDQAEFAAGAHFKTYHLRALVTETDRPVVVSPQYVEEQQARAERACPTP